MYMYLCVHVCIYSLPNHRGLRARSIYILYYMCIYVSTCMYVCMYVCIHIICPITAAFAPVVVLISAGFDAAEGDAQV